MKPSFLLPVFVLVCGLFACDKPLSGPEPDPVSVDSVSQIARMNRTLAWKLFNQEQLGKPGETVLIAPFSIQTALFMAQNGAKGNTRDEMLALMDCTDCSLDDLNALHRDLTTLLTEQSGDAEVTVANRFFYDNNRLNLHPPFAVTLNEYFECGSESADFNAEQAALDLINGWVKNNTNQKIDKILDQIGPLDVAFLINALHFKSDWATGFSPQLTQSLPFTKADGMVVQKDFVNADRNFTYAQTGQFNLVDIPFRDSMYSLSLIQPSAANTDPNWHQSITPDTWLAMYAGAHYSRADVYFPKMELAFEDDLVNSLRTLGMQDAFSEIAADFSGLGTSPTGNRIFINQIRHKAVLNVDEQGAEGAAVTSIGFAITSAPPTFHFNHPFVLVLRHVPTNTVMFLGYVAE